MKPNPCIVGLLVRIEARGYQDVKASTPIDNLQKVLILWHRVDELAPSRKRRRHPIVSRFPQDVLRRLVQRQRSGILRQQLPLPKATTEMISRPE